MIKSLGAQQAAPVAEIEFVRTRDSLTTMSALQAPAAIIHVMAHGGTDPDSLGFWDDRSELTLTELAEQFHAGGEGIEAGVFLADCCNTAQGRFVRAIRDCIEEPITYIGASKSVDWHESTTFASAFYGAYSETAVRA